MNIILSLACLLASSLASLTFAQPIPTRQADRIDLLTHTPPQVYQNQMVIRVRTTSQSQLNAMLALTESVWTEHTGIGPLDIQIKRTNLPAITALGIPHEVLIEDLQAHTNENWNQLVEIERLERKSHNNTQRGTGVHDDEWFSRYKQLLRITDYINNIVALRPDLASSDIIGQSWEGRDMFSITITGPDTPENPKSERPVIFIFSTVHAREWIAPMTTTYYASKFVEDYDTNPRIKSILDSARIVIVPIGNPDGYQYSWSIARLWRKTRRDNGNGTFGVDINRNWGYEWGGSGSSGSSGSDTFRGTEPFSEPETRTIRDFAQSFGNQLIAHMEYHSYSQLIMWPFGYEEGVVTPEPAHTHFDLLSHELADEIEAVHTTVYDPIQAIDLYAHAGNSPDWFFGELNIPSMLIELRPAEADFHPDPINILPCAQENYAGIQHYIERALEPVSLFNENPSTVVSKKPYELGITAINGHQNADPSSFVLHARNQSTDQFQEIALAPDGLTRYSTTMPPLACGNTVEYYFTASTTDGLNLIFPTNGDTSPFTILAEQLVVSYFDELELDSGWTVNSKQDTATAGNWTRMDPEGTLYQPEDDHSFTGTDCWITDGFAGTSPSDGDVDGGYTTLTSPLIDASASSESVFSFWYFYTGPVFSVDKLQLSISNDNGTTWIQYESLPPTDRAWKFWSGEISQVIKPTDQLRFRFTVYDLGNDTIIEAAIDDLSIEFLGCPTSNQADLNNDGILDHFDISIFLNAFASQNPIADLNSNGIIDFYDVSIFIIAFGQG